MDEPEKILPLDLATARPPSLSGILFAATILIILLVGTSSYLFIQNQKLTSQLSVSPSPAPSATVSPSADPTAGWQTYTNTKQNLTFKYPTTWDLTETPGDEVNGQTLNQNVSLSRPPASISMNFNLDGIGGSGMDLEGEPYEFNGLQLYKYRREMENGNTLVGLTDTLQASLGIFQYQGKTYSISLVYPNNVASFNYEADFETLLTTFKFND